MTTQLRYILHLIWRTIVRFVRWVFRRPEPVVPLEKLRPIPKTRVQARKREYSPMKYSPEPRTCMFDFYNSDGKLVGVEVMENVAAAPRGPLKLGPGGAYPATLISRADGGSHQACVIPFPFNYKTGLAFTVLPRVVKTGLNGGAKKAVVYWSCEVGN